MSAGVFVEAARPRTLVAAISPVLVGTAAAEVFIAWRFVTALVVAVAIQVGVNYANDYFDGVRGIDAERAGPRRAVASGTVAPQRMMRATSVAFLVAAAAGIPLAVVTSPWLLVLGAACFVAALLYSGGPKPYGSIALGEVAVFVFFGVVATVGSAFVQEEELRALQFASAVPVGILAAAILAANNARDIDSDERAGKATLAVLLGPVRTRALYRGLVYGGLGWTAVVAAVDESAWPLLALAAVPVAAVAVRAMDAARDSAGFLAALSLTARLHIAYGALLAVGLWAS